MRRLWLLGLGANLSLLVATSPPRTMSAPQPAVPPEVHIFEVSLSRDEPHLVIEGFVSGESPEEMQLYLDFHGMNARDEKGRVYLYALSEDPEQQDELLDSALISDLLEGDEMTSFTLSGRVQRPGNFLWGLVLAGDTEFVGDVTFDSDGVLRNIELY